MSCDLNVVWSENGPDLQRTLFFLNELGYDTVALTATISGKLPGDLTPKIPDVLSFDTPKNLKLFRRCTLTYSDPSQNYRLSSLASKYDLLALRPTNEKALLQACTTPECDIISIDMAQRLDYHFSKMKLLAQAIESGIKFEICYGPSVVSDETNARRNLISNATQLIRATRGRGIIISSEANRAAACRAPCDVMNLLSTWGLAQDRAKEAVTTLCKSVLATSRMKRLGYRGAVKVLPTSNPACDQSPKAVEHIRKRKIGSVPNATAAVDSTKPVHQDQAKRQKTIDTKTIRTSAGGQS